MPDAAAVGDLRGAGRFGQAVIRTGHARTRRDDLTDLAGGAEAGFRQRRDRSVDLADHADLHAADRLADAGAVAAAGQLAGFAQ